MLVRAVRPLSDQSEEGLLGLSCSLWLHLVLRVDCLWLGCNLHLPKGKEVLGTPQTDVVQHLQPLCLDDLGMAAANSALVLGCVHS